MSTPTISQDMRAVSDIVEAINDAWSSDRAEDVRPYLHPKMVIVAPDATFRAEGRDVCVQSYVDFTRAATIRQFKAEPPIVDIFGDTAVTTCAFEISYEIGGKSYEERGTDIVVFHREGRDGDEGRWQAVWRTTNARPLATEADEGP